MKVGHGSGNAHQQLTIPCADAQVAVLKHALYTDQIVHRPTFTERGAVEQVDKLVGGDGVVLLVGDHFLGCLKYVTMLRS